MSMNPEIKQQWIDALLSGEYKQGKKTLRTQDDHFCCLGVLTDLHLKSCALEWTKDDKGRNVSPLDPEYHSLPGNSVLKWAGLPEHNPVVMTETKRELPLAYFNDSGRSFESIAAMIERSL